MYVTYIKLLQMRTIKLQTREIKKLCVSKFTSHTNYKVTDQRNQEALCK